SPGQITEHFTLNFTITNLMFTTDLKTPNSPKFRSTEKIMRHYVSQSPLVFPLKSPRIWAVSQSMCLTFFLRSGRHRYDTGVDAVCSYKDNASLARFDREKLYQELSTMTDNVTKLGHYSLDRNSLYVDG
ncbi:MUC16 protein, partial [Atrichornis clamosus]|nr:MUC16 protein [Atrichornis clamosus]